MLQERAHVVASAGTAPIDQTRSTFPNFCLLKPAIEAHLEHLAHQGCPRTVMDETGAADDGIFSLFHEGLRSVDLPRLAILVVQTRPVAN